MATSRTPGSIGHNIQFATHGKSWCDVGCQRGHKPGPIRVADAPSKKTTKAPSAPTPIDTIIWHFYEGTLIKQGFSRDDFFTWFRAAYDRKQNPEFGKWDTEGINLEFHTNPKTGGKDFEASLQKKGAIVVYVGHSELTAPKVKGDPLGPSLGLWPDLAGKGPVIKNATLRTLLSKSAASLVIIGSCDSKTAVGKISAGPPIVVTNSGNNRTTDISRMARAAGTFIFLLFGWEMDEQIEPNNPHKSGNGTIKEALAASAEAFTGIEDRFELVHGDDSIKLIS